MSCTSNNTFLSMQIIDVVYILWMKMNGKGNSINIQPGMNLDRMKMGALPSEQDPEDMGAMEETVDRHSAGIDRSSDLITLCRDMGR